MPSFSYPRERKTERKTETKIFISQPPQRRSHTLHLNLHFLFRNIKNFINVLMQKICIILSCPWCLFYFSSFLDYLRRIPSRNKFIPSHHYFWNLSSFSNINWKIKSGLRSRISLLLILRLAFSFLMSHSIRNVLGKRIFSFWDLHIFASSAKRV